LIPSREWPDRDIGNLCQQGSLTDSRFPHIRPVELSLHNSSWSSPRRLFSSVGPSDCCYCRRKHPSVMRACARPVDSFHRRQVLLVYEKSWTILEGFNREPMGIIPHGPGRRKPGWARLPTEPTAGGTLTTEAPTETRARTQHRRRMNDDHDELFNRRPDDAGPCGRRPTSDRFGS
jgi:hypothetical protein